MELNQQISQADTSKRQSEEPRPFNYSNVDNKDLVQSMISSQASDLTQRARSRGAPTSSFNINSQDGELREYLLPPEQPALKKGKKTLVLDLDETLLHSQFQEVDNADIVITINTSTNPNQVVNQQVYACKRPYCDKFLQSVAPLYEIVMFTASMSRYAQPIFDQLDPQKNIIDHCLYREHCTNVKRDLYVKDLTRLGRPIEDIIILDNSPNSYLFQPQNAIPCISWYDDQSDDELNLLILVFQKLSLYKGDIRRILHKINSTQQSKSIFKRANQRYLNMSINFYKANKILDRILTKQAYDKLQQDMENRQDLAPNFITAADEKSNKHDPSCKAPKSPSNQTIEEHKNNSNQFDKIINEPKKQQKIKDSIKTDQQKHVSKEMEKMLKHASDKTKTESHRTIDETHNSSSKNTDGVEVLGKNLLRRGKTLFDIAKSNFQDFFQQKVQQETSKNCGSTPSSQGKPTNRKQNKKIDTLGSQAESQTQQMTRSKKIYQSLPNLSDQFKTNAVINTPKATTILNEQPSKLQQFESITPKTRNQPLNGTQNAKSQKLDSDTLSQLLLKNINEVVQDNKQKTFGLSVSHSQQQVQQMQVQKSNSPSHYQIQESIEKHHSRKDLQSSLTKFVDHSLAQQSSDHNKTEKVYQSVNQIQKTSQSSRILEPNQIFAGRKPILSKAAQSTQRIVESDQKNNILQSYLHQNNQHGKSSNVLLKSTASQASTGTVQPSKFLHVFDFKNNDNRTPDLRIAKTIQKQNKRNKQDLRKIINNERQQQCSSQQNCTPGQERSLKSQHGCSSILKKYVIISLRSLQETQQLDVTQQRGSPQSQQPVGLSPVNNSLPRCTLANSSQEQDLLEANQGSDCTSHKNRGFSNFIIQANEKPSSNFLSSVEKISSQMNHSQSQNTKIKHPHNLIKTKIPCAESQQTAIKQPSFNKNQHFCSPKGQLNQSSTSLPPFQAHSSLVQQAKKQRNASIPTPGPTSFSQRNQPQIVIDNSSPSHELQFRLSPGNTGKNSTAKLRIKRRKVEDDAQQKAVLNTNTSSMTAVKEGISAAANHDLQRITPQAKSFHQLQQKEGIGFQSELSFASNPIQKSNAISQVFNLSRSSEQQSHLNAISATQKRHKARLEHQIQQQYHQSQQLLLKQQQKQSAKDLEKKSSRKTSEDVRAVKHEKSSINAMSVAQGSQKPPADRTTVLSRRAMQKQQRVEFDKQQPERNKQKLIDQPMMHKSISQKIGLPEFQNNVNAGQSGNSNRKFINKVTDDHKQRPKHKTFDENHVLFSNQLFNPDTHLLNIDRNNNEHHSTTRKFERSINRRSVEPAADAQHFDSATSNASQLSPSSVRQSNEIYSTKLYPPHVTELRKTKNEVFSNAKQANKKSYTQSTGRYGKRVSVVMNHQLPTTPLLDLAATSESRRQLYK